MRFFECFGSYYNTSLNEARVRWSYRANERLSFDFSQQWNKLQLPVPGGNFSVLFGGFQTNYSFSRFLMLTALVQVNTANNQALTGQSACDGTIVPTAIFTSSTLPDSALPA